MNSQCQIVSKRHFNHPKILFQTPVENTWDCMGNHFFTLSWFISWMGTNLMKIIQNLNSQCQLVSNRHLTHQKQPFYIPVKNTRKGIGKLTFSIIVIGVLIFYKVFVKRFRVTKICNRIQKTACKNTFPFGL